jgi:hypothetical protein
MEGFDGDLCRLNSCLGAFFVDTLTLSRAIKLDLRHQLISTHFMVCVCSNSTKNRSIHAYLFSSPRERTSTVRNLKTNPLDYIEESMLIIVPNMNMCMRA